MGEVYRATDTTLGREVAIKVLPPEVAHDPERLGRFKREAHLLASLNHPHVAAIYGLEEADGKPFLALELVEGEDLKERLARGAIPVDEALEIAEQVAEALEEAHAKGIVHRDLKPANVKLKPDGKVKVLDFGLAKAWSGEANAGSSSSSALSESPTLARTGTMAGVILGTAAYMSPEQARGKPVDKRADVWSFGVLLWEILTGRALFAGDTVTDVIAAVVTKEPDLDALPASTPRAVRRLVSRCLRKDPRTRLPDMGAARLELQEVLAGTSTDAEAPPRESAEASRTARRQRARERGAFLAVALALGGLLAFLLRERLSEAPERRSPAHFVLDTPEDLAFWPWSPVAVSPDGRHVAIIGTSSTGTRQLWLRPLDATEARPLPGTVGALGGHFWSPDSASIAFAAEGELRRITLASGTVQRLSKLPQEFDAGTWGAEETIVFAAGGPNTRLYSLPAAGGEARLLTSPDEGRKETGHGWPQFLSDGRRLLFVVGAADEETSGLYVTSLASPALKRRLGPANGRFQVVPGHLLFVRDGNLMAQPFDPRALATTGEAVTLASSVAAFASVPTFGWFSASATGRVAWLSTPSSTDTRLEWVDRNGRTLGALGEASRYGQFALSPDGRRVAAEVANAEGRYDLWLIDVARGVPSRLTTDPGDEREPVWSPDSKELVFTSDATGDQNILRKGIQGADAAAPLPNAIGQTSAARDIPEGWVRDKSTLLYLTIGEAERTLWAASLDGREPPEALVKGFAIDEPRVSPDGRWLAYISDQSGSFEVYVEPFRRPGEKMRVSATGGGQPRWRGDGKELFFLAADGSLMAVAVGTEGAGLTVGLPTALVPAKTLRAALQGPDYDDYDVAASGQRFLVKRGQGLEPPRIHVLLDWPSRLVR